MLAALISGGHVLLEDVPGTAKTMLARSLAQTIEGAEFARLQCTPDLQPTDVTGLSIYNQRSREFEFRPGPVFANVVLVDEVNRAMPRTQSALLEAMAERQVTVDGLTRRLPDPFFVIATENPIEQEGTFPLPEAQLDRFALRAALGYPDEDEEVSIVLAQRHGHPIDQLRAAVTTDDVQLLQRATEDVYIDELVLRWTVELVRATRDVEGVAIGASVRGSLTLERTARAWALLQGRDHVVPNDVEQLFLPVLGHRLVLTTSFLAETRGLGRERGARADPRPMRSSSHRRPRPAGTDRAVPSRERRTFPLVPRRRRTGLPFGDLPSRRRGHGSDVIGHRPYEPGDPVSAIDWFGDRTALGGHGRRRVRRTPKRAADEAPRVVLVVDRRPAMGLYPAAAAVVLETGGAHRGAASRSSRAPRRPAPTSPLSTSPTTRPGGSRRGAASEAGWSPSATARAPFDAPEDTLALAIEFLGRHRANLPAGSFVFVLSDFLAAPTTETLARRAQPRLGRRAGDPAGPGLGAQLPGGRGRRGPGRRPP